MTRARSKTDSQRPAALEWLCLVVGLFLVLHYAWLMDDAYIYFRYVDNALFLGYGLVYNAGEYVEGFSSPLWTLVLLLLRSTGQNYWILIRLLGLASFVAFFFLLVALQRRNNPRGAPVLNLPLVVLTSTYGVVSYFTSGMETPLVLVSAALYALFTTNPGARSLQLALAFTPLVRHELVLPFALCVAYAWWSQRRAPRWMLFTFAISTGSWLFFRITYYADLLPVTFYLKNANDLRQGMIYLWDSLGTYGLPWLLALAAASVALLRGAAEDRSAAALHLHSRAFSILLGISVAAYVVKIGGDAIHFRYLAFPYVLWVCAAAGVTERGLVAGRPRLVGATLWAAPVVLGVWTLLLHPAQLDRHPFSRREANALVNKINDASLHRRNAGLTPDPWGSGTEMEQRQAYTRFLAEAPATPYTSVMSGWWCVDLYRRFDTRIVHGYGLTDAVLARVDTPSNRPGHKDQLTVLAKDLVRIASRAGERAGVDMYRRAVGAGIAAPWIAANLDTIELIARKVYNRHDPAENLGLALSFPGPIEVDRGG